MLTRAVASSTLRGFSNATPRARLLHQTSVRWKSTTPMNTAILFVPQQEAWVVERMGKFHQILKPGFNFLIPLIDKISYVQSLKEIAIDVPQQSAITLDNVTLNLDGVLYLRIVDPYKASYGVEDAEFAITQLAQTTMRSELGKIQLDSVFKERENLNFSIVEQINRASSAWGIDCLRYEIRDITLPKRVQEAMQMQVEAERKKRAAILESEGKKKAAILESEGNREAQINIAEGKKRAMVLASEGEKQEIINQAVGEAEGLIARAEARAKSLEVLSSALENKNGMNAASLNIAELYVNAFQQLAKTNNTLILPANASDVTSMVGQAMTMYKTLAQTNGNPMISEAQDSNSPVSADSLDEYFSDDEDKPKKLQ